MNVVEAKQQFISFLFGRPAYKRAVSHDLYLTRCPFCGDSRTTLNTGHLYILVQPDTNNKMVYYCQKCQEHGIVGSELVTLLNGDESVMSSVLDINKKGTASSKSYGGEFKPFNAVIPDIVAPAYVKKIRYIENRLGITIDEQMIQDLRIIVSPYDFLVSNDIKKIQYKWNMMNCLERDYVGFLSTGGSHILFRDITGTYKLPWLKYPIFPESKYNHVLYTMSSVVDVFSRDTVTVNLSEGVMDAVGIKQHFYSTTEHDVNIAVCGRNYYATLKWLVSMGIFGSNVNVNFYLDNDQQYNNGKEMEIPAILVDRVKALFGEVYTYKNLIGKDFGVTKDKIMRDRRIL